MKACWSGLKRWRVERGWMGGPWGLKGVAKQLCHHFQPLGANHPTLFHRPPFHSIHPHRALALVPTPHPVLLSPFHALISCVLFCCLQKMCTQLSCWIGTPCC